MSKDNKELLGQVVCYLLVGVNSLLLALCGFLLLTVYDRVVEADKRSIENEKKIAVHGASHSDIKRFQSDLAEILATVRGKD